MKKKILEIHQLLNRALTIAIDEYNDAWIVAEWATNQTELEGYGYTGELEERIQELEERIQELEERIQDLEERLEKLQDVEGRLPPLTSLVDAMKMEYFLEHFREIPLEALEWIVKESKALELENARLRQVILEAVSQRFPKRAGIQFLQEKGIIV